MDDAKLIVPVVGYFRCREDSGHEDLRGIYAHGAMAFVAAASDVHPVGLDTIAGHARKAADLASLIFPTGGLQSTHRWRHYLRAREALAYAVPQASEQLIIIKVQHLNQLRRSSDGWLIERHEHYGELSSHATMRSLVG